MRSKPPEFRFHEIQAFEGLDFINSRLRRLRFHQSQAPGALDFMKSGLRIILASSYGVRGRTGKLEASSYYHPRFREGSKV